MWWMLAAMGCGAIAPAVDRGEAEPPRGVITAELSASLALSRSETGALRAAEATFAPNELGHLRNTAWIATVRGCRDACFGAVMDGLARARTAGFSGVRAADLVLAAVGPAPGPERADGWASAVAVVVDDELRWANRIAHAHPNSR